MGIIGLLILFFLIDFFITSFLSILGTPRFLIDIIVAFVLAFLYSFIRNRGGEPFYQKKQFHQNFATIFVILLAISLIFGYLL